MTYVDHGRCRSGQSWFWYAALLDYDYPRCDDPACEPGLHPHEYGWEDTEDLALEAMTGAVARLGGEVRKGCYQGNAPGRASAASAALKRINAARRKARPRFPPRCARQETSSPASRACSRHQAPRRPANSPTATSTVRSGGCRSRLRKCSPTPLISLSDSAGRR